MNRTAITYLSSALVLFVACEAMGLQINPVFHDGAGETWTAERVGVFYQAVNEWEASILDSGTVVVDVEFANAGTSGYLGRWAGSGSFSRGTDIYPWTNGIEHTIIFNADLFDTELDDYLWWDPTPLNSDDMTYSTWDALTIARHEMGHMLGFADGLFVDDFSRPFEVNRWTSQISGTTFDPGGLNVSLAGAGNLSHVLDSGDTADDLMTAALATHSRQRISQTDLDMLALAHDYTVQWQGPIMGDVNDSGYVNDDDLAILLAYWDYGSSWAQGDFDDDNIVDDDDLALLLAYWHEGTPPAPAAPGMVIPEPATLAIMCMGAVVLIRRKTS